MPAIPGLWDFVQKVANWFVDVVSWTVQRFGRVIVISVIAVGLTYLLWDRVDSARDKQITLLVGPSSGSGEEIYNVAKRSVASFNSSDWLGDRYTLTPQWTGGSIEHISRLNSDVNGSLAAFVEDGTASGEDNVRTLLPLGEMFLHVVVRKEFLERLRDKAGKLGINLDEPNFEKVANAISELQEDADDVGAGAVEPFPCRLYVGPPQSGTRKVALMLLNEFGIRSDDVQTPGVADFSEMRTALRTGRLHGAFILSNPGSKLIRGIAMDGQCRLLGIGDAVGWSAYLPTLRAGRIPGDMYSSLDPEFCPGGVSSLYSRLILASSRSMDDSRAYAVASAFHDALRSRFPKPPWDDKSVFAVEKQPASGLAFPIHNGAKWLQNNHVPNMIGDHPWISIVIGIGLLAIAAAVFDWLRGWWERRTQRAAAAADAPLKEVEKPIVVETPQSPEATLLKQVHEMLGSIVVAVNPDRSQVDAWAKRLGNFRKQTSELQNLGQLSSETSAPLVDSLRKIALLLPRPRENADGAARVGAGSPKSRRPGRPR